MRASRAVSLLVLAVGCGLWPALGARAAGEATPARAVPSTTPAGQQAATSAPTTTTSAPTAGTGGLRLRRDKPIPTISESPAPGLLYRMLAYMAIILVLGGVAIVVARKLLPRMGAARSENVSVVETVYLAPRKALHLVQVGSKRFLLARTRERVSMLAEVTGAFGQQDDEASGPG